MNSVRWLIERVEVFKSEIECLVFVLVRRGMVERVRVVEVLMVEVLEVCERVVSEVFVMLKFDKYDVVVDYEEIWWLVGGDVVL